MTRYALLPALLLLVVASPAAASEEGGGLVEFAWEAGNLLLLLGVLFYLGRKPVLNYLSERRQRIQDNLASSEQLLKEAEDRLGLPLGTLKRLQTQGLREIRERMGIAQKADPNSPRYRPIVQTSPVSDRGGGRV